jgi:hypothetical protein
LQARPGIDLDNSELEAAVASMLYNNTSNERDPPKRTMKDKMKRFGRNYVLPFLDQVVGDRKHEEGISETKSSSNQEGVEESTSVILEGEKSSNLEENKCKDSPLLESDPTVSDTDITSKCKNEILSAYSPSTKHSTEKPLEILTTTSDNTHSIKE